jgi:hypothetical protein
MLRLFYLFLLAGVMLAPGGCAAPAWWLAGDAAADDMEPRVKPRAGSAQIDATDDDERVASGKQSPTDSARRSTSAAKGGHEVASRQQSQPASSEQSLAKSPGKESAISADSADPLVEQVRALGIDDPAEEGSALAALRAAPPAHRSFLLRTMRASAAVRKQHEARAAIGSQGNASADRAQYSALSSPGVPGHNSANTARRREPVVDSNAVAVIEVEPAKELPGVVRPASYNGPMNPAGAERTFDSPSVAAMGAKVEPAEQANTVWQAHLGNAIAILESELTRGGGTDRAANEAKLRLLQLAAGRRDEALRSRQGTTMNEQEFWSKEVYGLAALLDTAKEPDAQRRAAVAAPHLRQAAERLGEIGGLAVKNLHFCTEVKGYGSFVRFPQDEFRPGQEVLLYCEVENFHSKLTEKGYHTALKARYQVFDATGNRVAEKDLGLKDEQCQNRRRDFFVPYFLWTPKQVPSGKYQLKITLEDVHAGQTAEASIEFSIKDK